MIEAIQRMNVDDCSGHEGNLIYKKSAADRFVLVALFEWVVFVKVFVAKSVDTRSISDLTQRMAI